MHRGADETRFYFQFSLKASHNLTTQLVLLGLYWIFLFFKKEKWSIIYGKLLSVSSNSLFIQLTSRKYKDVLDSNIIHIIYKHMMVECQLASRSCLKKGDNKYKWRWSYIILRNPRLAQMWTVIEFLFRGLWNCTD